MTVGKSNFKIDAHGKVTGDALYPGDLVADKMLHAKVMFSGQPHARMLSMDTTAALQLPGVIAIFTAADVPVNEYGLTLFDQPVFVGLGASGRARVASDISRWEGDHIALIVAESEEIATAARELIKVEWQQLPRILSVEEARKDDLLLHPENKSNIIQHYKIRKGDMTAGWAAADVIVEADYEVPHQEHAYLQPEAALAYVDEAGRPTVQIGGQWTHEDQEQIAHALDLPLDKIRVIYPAIGGAFGGREDMSLQIVMALAAWRLAEQGETRPIRAIWSREESIVGHHKRHQVKIHARWGATRDGKITAVSAEALLDGGAYNYTSNKVLGNLHMSLAGPYDVPNAHIDSYAIYTNNVPGGAFRGFGSPQGAFVAENQMNKLAEQLNIDPVALRLKNVLHEGVDSIVQTPLPKGVSIAEVVAECAAVLRAGADSAKADLRAFATLPDSKSAIRRGRGIACAMKNVGFSFGFPERCEATIELLGDSKVEQVLLYHAAADVGQGAHTALCQMAAQAIGVSAELVAIIPSDTATSGDSGSVSASRMTFMAGNAIRGSAERALAAWENEERPARGHFRYVPPPTEAYDPETGVCNPNFSYGYVAEGVELAVDIETGHIMIERVVCANDVGKAINPNLVEGQIEGAVVQAQGYAITENLQLADGHILNPRFSSYLIPGIRDVPNVVESVIMEIPDPLGPWGARGMAEMPLIPLAPAITAALHDATGVWFDKLPLTPETIVAGIAKKAD